LFIIACCFFSFLSCSEKSTVLFQDNFELGALGETPSNPWVVSGNGAVLIDDANFFSGNQSAYFKSGEGFANRAFLSLSKIFPIPNNTYYGSMQMYVSKGSPNGVHWTMIQSSGTVGNHYKAAVRYGGQHHQQLMANYDTKGVASDCWQHSRVKIPEKRWFKVQWYFNGPENTMQLWIDNQEIDQLKVTGFGEGCVHNDTQNKWIFPVFEKLDIGWVDYQKNGGTRHVWIDDVVISTAFIK